MKIALFGKYFNESFNDAIYKIFELLNKNKVDIYVYKDFYKFIKENLFFEPKIAGFFKTAQELNGIDLVFSIGGDGTFLECVSLLKKKNIPILGINSGHLGFLATVSKNSLPKALDYVLRGKYLVEERALLQVITEDNVFGDFNYGLNELTVQKKDTSSMLSIDLYVDDNFVATYWADGLIVATPTGSTAYSLSAGGPIVVPGSNNFVITPIAPHNLTIRPLVVPDSIELKISVHGRSDEFLAALDARNVFLKNGTELILQKANYMLKTVTFPGMSFFKTLRVKLMWGIDRRNN